MKKDLHPESYRPVASRNIPDDEVFITKSTASAKGTIEIDGEVYPLIKIEIFSTSHPFYTGKVKLVDTTGRIDRFMSRYGNRGKKADK